MKGIIAHNWTSIKLLIYNYGKVSTIATFDKNQHDAMKVCKFFNDELNTVYKKIPDDIFYIIQYRQKGQVKYCFINSYEKLDQRLYIEYKERIEKVMSHLDDLKHQLKTLQTSVS